ncbi:MAG: UDP-N-acetylmuramate:L-alanyl-gamma-D-glutamyl-meso-diaminopimelate ligase [Xanthomonadales bacterium]|nr:UDP-N-acetylmuramate:L-alanyl-gamma-D-glutamyl-meso-diaminopimelate ligase [Gammaproteobacteria bacterium]MBT8051382.1 UDP-N-acetylmuramate:L-alanyl-gamma-D-glutamyl-meso-diaminopimelate ligase [Gammaproteobacteria bacterium]MBT8056916.1 UDP-N-acetylmuramate:L-alanyl-gamma-D-glutamyl-meso-diaminopimelate ligase [Gammaproteobacteria bacterium]NNJ78893.1 UDP-N-acetylmuramate:L-alanyl-gamma-D-glutamyl-meso-diaminopimelate ligase [Xanthomonadales bacterium]NNL05936.1 UDP-N-acetylmuramate:L-alany
MHIHILGACGTFMGGVALLAKRAGHRVSGQDQHTYPPMSTQLKAEGIELHEGYEPDCMQPHPDLVVIGNALSRGNPAVEYVLDSDIDYVSGPRWLGENYLKGKTVIAVAGTHGKTSTSSMIAWMLEEAGLAPGFLIGGIPSNFGYSARDGDSIFVVEADEYDTAFFDKRAKLVHYRPLIATINNLEFDHADIYPDIKAIQVQFHHFVRTIPGKGTIISNGADPRVETVLDMGCWSKLERFSEEDGAHWQVRRIHPDGSELEFLRDGESLGSMSWGQIGRHNALNACAALGAAVAAGADARRAVQALGSFAGVKRRLELIHDGNDIRVYSDFAHHPTAIRLTLEGLRRNATSARILVGMEPRSNTMRSSVHAQELAPALTAADRVWVLTGEGIDWDPVEVLAPLEGAARVVSRSGDMLEQMLDSVRPGDLVVFMSNGGFDSIPERFCKALRGEDG